MSPRTRLILALLALLLAADSLWRLAVDSCRALPYESAIDRLHRLRAWHPAPQYALELQADMSWEYVQSEKSMAAVEYVWGLTRDVWLLTGRDRDRARAAWLAVMLQHTVAESP